jgi:ATP-dependent RNA/DNA helicase IGHMBP2
VAHLIEIRHVGDGISKLQDLWTRERDANVIRASERRAGVPLSKRVARGEAIKGVHVAELGAATGGRHSLTLHHPQGLSDDLRLRGGSPVQLWWDEDGPDGATAISGVVRQRTAELLEVIIDEDPPQRLLTGQFNVDADDPLTTFKRGDEALSSLAHCTPGSNFGKLRAILFGNGVPTFNPAGPDDPLDSALNAGQCAAVVKALAARHIAFIHGPPGTGKTRTLIEVVRRAVARGERVLACAMSNTATDHLAAGLLAAGQPIVRLGHPARISPALERHSLDAIMAERSTTILANKWALEGRELRRRAFKRRDRGQIRHSQFRDMLNDARRLERDARDQLGRGQRALLANAQVVCATASGASARLLNDSPFDLVVLDEATQAPDPIALIALLRAGRVVLAGDPEQLPPTVIDPEVEADGLGVTLFERLETEHPSAGIMLTEQYRMHCDLMAFPSQTRYHGQLTAHPSVAQHLLADLGVAEDPERIGPLVLIDTAGKGWSDEPDASDVEASTRNILQGERTAREVRRLLSRGLAASDLAVITPYRAQRRLLRSFLTDALEAGLEIGTVDGFQGREKEAIIVDLVRSNDEGLVGFVADRRRLNVAFTRARRLLMVIGDTATLGATEDFETFLNTVDARGDWVSAWSDEADPL